MSYNYYMNLCIANQLPLINLKWIWRWGMQKSVWTQTMGIYFLSAENFKMFKEQIPPSGAANADKRILCSLQSIVKNTNKFQTIKIISTKLKCKENLKHYLMLWMKNRKKCSMVMLKVCIWVKKAVLERKFFLITNTHKALS